MRSACRPATRQVRTAASAAPPIWLRARRPLPRHRCARARTARPRRRRQRPDGDCRAPRRSDPYGRRQPIGDRDRLPAVRGDHHQGGRLVQARLLRASQARRRQVGDPGSIRGPCRAEVRARPERELSPLRSVRVHRRTGGPPRRRRPDPVFASPNGGGSRRCDPTITTAATAIAMRSAASARRALPRITHANRTVA